MLQLEKKFSYPDAHYSVMQGTNGLNKRRFDENTYREKGNFAPFRM